MLYTYMYSVYEFHHGHQLSDVDAVYIHLLVWIHSGMTKFNATLVEKAKYSYI